MGTAIVALLGGEWSHWVASRRLVPHPGGDREVVVVLGWRNPGARANALNRWRVRAGLRSAIPGRTTRLILSGGPAAGGTSEAALMAAYARDRGYRGPVVTEETSRTTWENIAHVIPLLEDGEAIKVVSHPLHALKARIYLRRQRPDLAARLTRADDYRLGEHVLLKPVLAVHGQWAMRGIPRSERR